MTHSISFWFILPWQTTIPAFGSSRLTSAANGFNSLHHVLLFFGGTEARKQFNLDRKRCEALAESIEVLISQHRRRRQNGGLLAIHHRFEGRAHGYLRLAIADIAAQ